MSDAEISASRAGDREDILLRAMSIFNLDDLVVERRNLMHSLTREMGLLKG